MSPNQLFSSHRLKLCLLDTCTQIYIDAFYVIHGVYMTPCIVIIAMYRTPYYIIKHVHDVIIHVHIYTILYILYGGHATMTWPWWYHDTHVMIPYMTTWHHTCMMYVPYIWYPTTTITVMYTMYNSCRHWMVYDVM